LISSQQAETIARNTLKKLSKKVETYDTEISERNIKEKELYIENNAGYTFYFKSKESLGSFVYVDLLPDGSLMGVQIRDENITQDELNQVKITKEKSEQLLKEYFNTHKVLKEFTKEIDGNFTLKQISFHGVASWDLTMKIKEYDDFTFHYIIDANTGGFLFNRNSNICF